MTESSISGATTSTKKKKKGLFKSIARGMGIKKKKKNADDESVVVGVALDGSLAGGFGGVGGGGGLGGIGGVGSPASSAGVPSSVGGSAHKSSSASGATKAANSAVPSPSNTNTTTTSSASTNNFNGNAISTPATKPIQVVLLLMDPTSRRFELLQLEFDSHKALVSDVLRQIQNSATEKSLRDMSYVGVCGRDGKEMTQGLRLSEFCQGNEVVMAMPKGMGGKETANLARPILGDPKVVEMLRPCGVVLQNTVPKPVKKSSSSISAGKKLTKISEEDIRRKEKKRASIPRGLPKPVEKAKKSKPSALPTLCLGVLLTILLFFTIWRHMRITRTITSGLVLLPGEWKSQCGILELFPEQLWFGKYCDSSSMLEMGTDGTLRYFSSGGSGERSVRWSVAGDFGGDSTACSSSPWRGGKDGGQCAHDGNANWGATFEKVGNSWIVVLGKTRTSLDKNVVKDFTRGGRLVS